MQHRVGIVKNSSLMTDSIISERELTFTFAICFRPSFSLSVCLLSVCKGLIVMVDLCNRADHYIFMLFLLLLSFFFSSPNLSGRRLDVYHTLAHGVALLRI